MKLKKIGAMLLAGAMATSLMVSSVSAGVVEIKMDKTATYNKATMTGVIQLGNEYNLTSAFVNKNASEGVIVFNIGAYWQNLNEIDGIETGDAIKVTGLKVNGVAVGNEKNWNGGFNTGTGQDKNMLELTSSGFKGSEYAPGSFNGTLTQEFVLGFGNKGYNGDNRGQLGYGKFSRFNIEVSVEVYSYDDTDDKWVLNYDKTDALSASGEEGKAFNVSAKIDLTSQPVVTAGSPAVAAVPYNGTDVTAFQALSEGILSAASEADTATSADDDDDIDAAVLVAKTGADAIGTLNAAAVKTAIDTYATAIKTANNGTMAGTAAAAKTAYNAAVATAIVAGTTIKTAAVPEVAATSTVEIDGKPLVANPNKNLETDGYNVKVTGSSSTKVIGVNQTVEFGKTRGQLKLTLAEQAIAKNAKKVTVEIALADVTALGKLEIKTADSDDKVVGKGVIDKGDKSVSIEIDPKYVYAAAYGEVTDKVYVTLSYGDKAGLEEPAATITSVTIRIEDGAGGAVSAADVIAKLKDYANGAATASDVIATLKAYAA